eukprot:jgi/Bigna1/75426/fgenesh1_pg.34_\
MYMHIETGVSVYRNYLPLPEGLIALNSTEGAELMKDKNTLDSPYWKLAIYLTTQMNGGACAVASASVVLNAISPPSLKGGFTNQTQLLANSQCMRNVIVPPGMSFREKQSGSGVAREDEAMVQQFFSISSSSGTGSSHLEQETSLAQALQYLSKHGTTLEKARRYYECYGVPTRVVYAAETTWEKFVADVELAARSQKMFIVVDFKRSSVGMAGHAHFSPIAALNQNSKGGGGGGGGGGGVESLMLVLDVARMRYPPYWLSSKKLFQAMNTTDNETSRSRGYLVIGE